MKTTGISRRAVLGSAVSVAAIPLLASTASALSPPEASDADLGAASEGGKPRYLQSATALRDGRILVTGGYHVDAATRDRTGAMPSASVEIYDPRSDQWFDAAPMETARARHASTLLPDGRVAVLGGFNGIDLDSVEIYDPHSDQWMRADSLPTPMVDHAACVSGTAIVLFGGRQGNSALSVDCPTAVRQSLP